MEGDLFFNRFDPQVIGIQLNPVNELLIFAKGMNGLSFYFIAIQGTQASSYQSFYQKIPTYPFAAVTHSSNPILGT